MNNVERIRQANIEKKWTYKVADVLIGRKIVKVEYMPTKEAEDADWYSRPICIQLDNVAWLVPMRDDEGNDGGSISTTYKDLPVIPVI